MKAHTFVIGFAILAGSSMCWAQVPSQPQTTGGKSLTREQVKAELEDARRKGLIQDGDTYSVEVPIAGAGKTRAQVLKELQEAQDQGLLNFHDGEYPVIRDTGPGKTRAEVLLELEQARRQGLLYTVDP